MENNEITVLKEWIRTMEGELESIAEDASAGQVADADAIWALIEESKEVRADE